MLLRLFPVGRGLFEDKVGSLWCAVDPVLKLKGRPDKGPVVLMAYVHGGSMGQPMWSASQVPGWDWDWDWGGSCG